MNTEKEFDKFVFTNDALIRIIGARDLFVKTKLFVHSENQKKIPVAEQMKVHHDQNILHFIRHLDELQLISKNQTIERSILKSELKKLQSLNFFNYLDQKHMKNFLENSLIASYYSGQGYFKFSVSCLKWIKQMEADDRLTISIPHQEVVVNNLNSEVSLVKFLYYLYVNNYFNNTEQYVTKERFLTTLRTVLQVKKMKLLIINNLIEKKCLVERVIGLQTNTTTLCLHVDLEERLADYKSRQVSPHSIQYIRKIVHSEYCSVMSFPARVPDTSQNNGGDSLGIDGTVNWSATQSSGANKKFHYDPVTSLLSFIGYLCKINMISVERHRINKIRFINELLRLQRHGKFKQIPLENVRLSNVKKNSEIFLIFFFLVLSGKFENITPAVFDYHR